MTDWGTPELAWPRRLALAGTLVLTCSLASCGAGVAAVVASAGGSSGGSTPALNAFEVVTPKVSPTQLRFDASQPVRVALFYDLGDPAGEQAMTRLGVTGNEVSLPAGESFLTWNFEAELGTTKFLPGVRLVVHLPGGPPINGGELTLGMGNDAPTIEGVFPPASEVVGTADVRFTVADSSSDLVDVRVEVNVDAPLFPEESWTLAHPAGLPPGTPTPALAFTGVRARTVAEGGTPLVFFWDVVGDLGR